MPVYVALLRGIAPTNPKMRNAELVAVFEQLGFTDVHTVISSGNVLFRTGGRSTSRLEARIEDAMLDHLGAPCSTIVRSRTEVVDLATVDVFDDHDDGPEARCMVTFLKAEPGSTVPPETGAGSTVLAVSRRAVFSVVDTTIARTPDLMARLEKVYGPQITTRSWRTVHRIVRAFDR